MSPTSPGESESRPPLTEEQLAEELAALLKRHANMLAEHFSSVQIIATKLEPDGGTRGFGQGSGDWYARLGAARAFLQEHKLNERRDE